MHGDFYFGETERDLFGNLIASACPGWIISKRVHHSEAGEEFSLQGVADLLADMYPQQCGGTYVVEFGNESEECDFNLYTVLGALEGMCHNGEAVEVADGYYYVGSYLDWENDKEAQYELEDFLANE